MPMPLNENDKFPDDSQVMVDNEDENAQVGDSEAEAVEHVSGTESGEFDSPGPSPSPHSSALGLLSPKSAYPAEPGSPLSALSSPSVGGAGYVDSPDLAVLDSTYLQSLIEREAEEEERERQPDNQDWVTEEVSWDTKSRRVPGTLTVRKPSLWER